MSEISLNPNNLIYKNIEKNTKDLPIKDNPSVSSNANNVFKPDNYSIRKEKENNVIHNKEFIFGNNTSQPEYQGNNMPQIPIPNVPGAPSIPIPPIMFPIIGFPMNGGGVGQPEQPNNNGYSYGNMPQIPIPNVPGAPSIPIPGQINQEEMKKVYANALSNNDSFTLFQLSKMDNERNIFPETSSGSILNQSYNIAVQRKESNLLLEISKYEFNNNLMPNVSSSEILNNAYNSSIYNRDARTLYRIADFESQVNLLPLSAEDIRQIARQIEVNYPYPNYPNNGGYITP
jgi:hypothetical protein